MAGGAVRSLNLTPVGGDCRWIGDVTPLWRSCIAWGGVLAQLALFATAYAVLLLIPRPESEAVLGVFYVLIASNLFMALVNLFPMAPLDGAEAWKVVPEGGRALLRRIRAARRGKDDSSRSAEARSRRGSRRW
jgi:Zn-dependent protease